MGGGRRHLLTEKRVSSWGWQSDHKARGLGPGIQAGGQCSRGLSSLSRRAGKTQEAPVLHLSMASCTLEESAPLADTAGLPWLEESGGLPEPGIPVSPATAALGCPQRG